MNTHELRRAVAVALLVPGLVTAAAGCGDDEATDTPRTTRAERTTTTADATTSTTGASPSSTTTAAGATTTAKGGGGATTTPTTQAPPADPLPDGTSFGFLTGVDVGASTITIDVAQLLTGDAAVQAAIEDGVLDPGETTIDNDYYIRNKNSKLRTAPVASGATVRTFEQLGSPDLTTSSLTTLAGDLAERIPNETDGIPVDVTATGGVVSSIEEVFFP